ncbi:hypothetical protein [Haloarcula marina]|uniref:hypothetical protein n=1 Tax=Haloarcula marina TaxID=2961574 RepID=UPI0020B843AE|nr:hypothetical protein [Halomicroarcula marina]
MLDDVEGPQKTRLVRLLIVLAIGIPILIEVITFGGLIGHYVAGSGGGGGAAGTPTPAIAGASTGDEILEQTPAVERIDDATVVVAEDGWEFSLTVAVNNTGQGPYELRLGPVTTRAGETVAGSGPTTGELAAGDTGSVTGRWLLPKGQRPDAVAVTVVTGDGEPTTSEYTVELGDIPVSA